MAQENQNDNFSESQMPNLPQTMLWIWVCLLSRDLFKKIYQFGSRRNSGGPFFTKGAKNQPHRVHLGVHEVQEE